MVNFIIPNPRAYNFRPMFDIHDHWAVKLHAETTANKLYGKKYWGTIANKISDIKYHIYSHSSQWWYIHRQIYCKKKAN